MQAQLRKACSVSIARREHGHGAARRELAQRGVDNGPRAPHRAAALSAANEAQVHGVWWSTSVDDQYNVIPVQSTL